MIRVGVFSVRKEILEMLQRYVGGILKDLAIVEPIKSLDAALEDRYDLYVVYSLGFVYRKLNTTIDADRIVAADFFPMPMGIKRVMSIPEGKTLGVIAGHYWDAADLLRQLMETGVRNYRFITGTTSEAASIQADYYLIPEECLGDITEQSVKSRLVVIPRSMAARSVSELIRKVFAIQRRERND